MSQIPQYLLTSCSRRILDDNQVLTRLRPITMEASEREACSPNTRIGILQEISTWVMTPTSTPEHPSNIFLLHGMAGCGKSAIATTIANYFRGMNRLGAFLFFSRKFPQRSSPSDVIRTIASQLATLDQRIGGAVAAAISKNSGATEGPLADQFNSLLLQPLNSLDTESVGISAGGPVLIILDAFDQCGTPATRAKLLELLSESFSSLPVWLRILVTTRGDRDISLALFKRPHITPHLLDVKAKSNIADVATYVRTELRRVRNDPKNVEILENEAPDWPGEEVAEGLTRRAAGLFVWAHTAISFIDPPGSSVIPTDRLRILLSKDISEHNPEAAMDNLYETALEAVGEWNDQDFIKRFMTVLGAVVVAEEPLLAEAIDYLLGQPKSVSSTHTIASLGCLLTWSKDHPIRIIHPSFHDYLSSPERCKECKWFINVAVHQRILAEKCLGHVLDHLKTSKGTISMLRTRQEARKEICEGLQHAYRYWIKYTVAVDPQDGVEVFADGIASFLEKAHFLSWCMVVDILWSRFIVLDLIHELLVWVTVRRYAVLFFS